MYALKILGLFKDPLETSDIAMQAQDCHLFFIPGLIGGMHVPLYDPNGTAGFIGLTPSIKSGEMVRAILESIAFGMKHLLESMKIESPQSLSNDSIM